MTTDEKIELACQITIELTVVTRTEWTKWIEYVRQKGLEKGLILAKELSRSEMLRWGPRLAYQDIANAIKNKKLKLPSESKELIEILGYIGWCIVQPLKRI